jgi:hypothetical protein
MQIIEAPLGAPRSTLLAGPAGCGKTTAAVLRLLHLLGQGVRADTILVWVPQRSLGRPYVEALRRPAVPAGARVDVLSIDGLARRTLDLFWPVIAGPAGFDPARDPVFLTLETAQYYMAQLLEPLLQRGDFGDVVLARNRLCSQILDNLNKSALVGFPSEEIGERLSAAWSGQSSRARVFQAVQEVASAFRAYCLQHNLLDFSLQLEVFTRHVWPRPDCHAYLLRRYRHWIVDNLEEDIPVAHDLLRESLAQALSCLLVLDRDGGFRSYLGADAQGAQAFEDLCDSRITLDRSFVSSPAVQALSAGLTRENSTAGTAGGAPLSAECIEDALSMVSEHFNTALLRHVADEVQRLLEVEAIPPAEIAVLAPFVDDALRFALTHEFERRKVPVRTHRPSRPLREEPAVRCLLTLARLAHPHWELCPHKEDVALALTQAIAGLDWVRASFLADVVYRKRDRRPRLSSFQEMQSEAKERVTYAWGMQYEGLRRWLHDYAAGAALPLDHFFGMLFDEVLGRSGYGFHSNYDAAGATANLIESARKFRWALDSDDLDELGTRYVRMVDEGVVAAQYLRPYGLLEPNAVFIGPAYSFLSENRPVQYQFWLNANSPGWGRRLFQPLTHPFVLTRRWPRERQWGEEDEYRSGQEMLRRVVLGLLRRCRTRVYLGLSDLNPRGREDRGPLQEWVQRLLREAGRSAGASAASSATLEACGV